MLSFEQFFFLVFLCVRCWGIGFEFCVFVAGWRHALRSEWPFIINIITGVDLAKVASTIVIVCHTEAALLLILLKGIPP